MAEPYPYWPSNIRGRINQSEVCEKGLKITLGHLEKLPVVMAAWQSWAYKDMILMGWYPQSPEFFEVPFTFLMPYPRFDSCGCQSIFGTKTAFLANL